MPCAQGRARAGREDGCAVVRLITAGTPRRCLQLTTNASLLTEPMAERLAPRLHHLVVSLNAACADTHERDMSNGEWERVPGVSLDSRNGAYLQDAQRLAARAG
ncbi:MAG: hypothetical protein QM767_05310 [Anaeromyxobacter sp.]